MYIRNTNCMSEKILEKILNKLNKLESTVDTIAIEVVDMKEQLKNTTTKEDLTQVKSNILGELDSFVKLHETLDQESAALKNSHSRLEERVTVVEKKLQTA